MKRFILISIIFTIFSIDCSERKSQGARHIEHPNVMSAAASEPQNGSLPAQTSQISQRRLRQQQMARAHMLSLFQRDNKIAAEHNGQQAPAQQQQAPIQQAPIQQRAQISKVIQLLNNHLKDERLKANESLQKFIADTGNFIQGMLEQRIPQDIIVKNLLDRYDDITLLQKLYPELPKILLKPKNLKECIEELVFRYTKKFKKDLDLNSNSTSLFSYSVKGMVMNFLIKPDELRKIFTDTIYHNTTISSVNFIANTDLLYIAYDDSVLKIKNLANAGEKIIEYQGSNIVLNSNNELCIECGNQAIVSSISYEPLELHEICKITHNFNPIYLAAFSPNNKLVATVSNNMIGITDISYFDNIQTVKVEAKTNVIAFSPDSQFLAFVEGNKVKIIDLKTDKTTVIEHTDLITSLAFSPDGKSIAIGSNDRTAKVIELGTKKILYNIEHDFAVNSVAFNALGNVLATSSYQTARMTDLWNNKTIHDLTFDECVEKVVFDPKDLFMAVVFDTNVKLIPLDIFKLDLKQLIFIYQLVKDAHLPAIRLEGKSKELFYSLKPTLRFALTKNLKFSNLINKKQLALLRKIQSAYDGEVITLNEEEQRILSNLPRRFEHIIQDVKLLYNHGEGSQEIPTDEQLDFLLDRGNNDGGAAANPG